MALTKVLTGGIADDAIGNTKLALDADYAFTGTISGAGLASPFPTGTTVTSVGGSNATNIAQGVLKGWIRFNGTGTIAIKDSFNYASITDHGTGDYTATLTTAMNNIFYAPTGGAGDGNYGCKIDLEHSATNTTTAMRFRLATSGTHDSDLVAIHIAGDLA